MTTPTNFLQRRRPGFILPFALAVTAVSAITAVMLISYFNGFSHSVHRAAARTRCRLAAQSVIEQTKIAIQNRFAQETPPMMRSDPMMVSVFCDWFSTLSNSSASNTVVAAKAGLGESGRTINSPVKMDDCIVYVGILPSTATTNATEAILPITATAELVLPDKQRVTATIMEQVRFYAGQNQVFNYAYFANNYGWMNSNNNDGDLFHINGDFRANGNVSINGSVVNGFIYAAANKGIGAPDYWGNPSGVDGIADVDARHWSASYYRSNTTKDMRPTDPIKTGGESWLGGYDAPSTTTGNQGQTDLASGNKPGTRSGTAGAPLVSQGLDPIEMPMISDLDGYVKYAQQQKGTLKCPQYTFTDSTGTKKTIAEKTVNAYYNDVGPSGNANLADKGALVLVGTYDKPVEIKGPVVVDSDVIISGYIKGQGVIYSGRNIHVLDNVYYKNGPDWSSVNNKNGSGTVSTVTQNNKDKDLVCFIAKGNVVIGNCSSTDWYNSIKKYISNDEAIYNTSQHDCDPSDKNIGYDTKFGGDYTSVEKTGTHLKVSSEPDYVWGSDGHRLKDSYGNYIKKLKNRNDRRYYQTVCDDAILGTFNKSNPNHLDGVFYNNHCIMGTVGNNSKNNMTIFGSLVCRNEALLVTTQGKMMFNWDNRLREGSPSHVAGLPLPRGLQTPHTYSWQEVPDEMNPIYQGQKSARDALGI